MTSLQPQVVPAPPARLGGLSPEVMLFAALLVLPALWHSVQGDLSLMIVLERYLIIVVGCAIVGTLLQRYSESAAAIGERLGRLEGGGRADSAERSGSRPTVDPFDLDVPALGADPAPALEPVFDGGFDSALGGDPLPDLASLDDIDPLDLLSDESAEDQPKTFSLFDE